MKIKSNIYRAHKTIGVIVFIPIFFWVMSGFMHPFMAHWFKPEIPKTTIDHKVIVATKIPLSIDSILKKQSIKYFQDIRIIDCQNKWYYQVQLNNDSTIYIDTEKGLRTPNFDQAYAIYLARYFTNDSSSNIKSITKQKSFDFYYKEINHLLPVWKIEFEREDKMIVYIETNSSRLGTFNDKHRSAFIWIFNTFHDWEFLPAHYSDRIRLTLVLGLSGFIFLTAFSGLLIYGFAWNKFKKMRHDNDKLSARRSHRKMGLLFSVFAFMFSFSGFYHASNKWNPEAASTENKILNASEFQFNQEHLFYNSQDSITHVSILNTQKETFIRLMSNYTHMVKWVSSSTGKASTENIDSIYSVEEAMHRSKLNVNQIQHVSFLDHFDNEYGFINKRLPVYKVEFNDTQKTTVYIEPSSNKTAACITNDKRKEGYSFAFLHKFVFLKGLGANVKDIATLLAALSILIVAYKGLKILRQ